MVGVPRFGVALSIALLLGALALGSVLGLATSTETRYAEMGREMRESDDYVLPRFDGAPRLEKPPLAIWAIAGSMALLGADDVAARVPSVVAGLLTLLVVAAAVRRLSLESERSDRSRFAFVVLGTMPAFVLQAYVVSTDVWLALFVALAGWALLEAERAAGSRTRRGWVTLLHASLALGMLAKGPLAVGLVVGAAAAASIARRNAGLLRPLGDLFGLAVLVAVAAPWYVAVESRMPGTLEELVTRRLFGTFSGAEVGHRHGAYAVWIPILGTLPWLAALPTVIGSLRSRRLWGRGPGLFLLCLALAAPVIFTFSANRLASYAAPAYAPLAMLLALGWPSGDDAAERARARRALGQGTLALGLAGAAIGAAPFIPALGLESVPFTWYVLPALTLVAAIASLVGSARERPAAGALLVSLSFLATLALAAVHVAPRIPASKPLAAAIERRRKPDEPVGAWLNDNGDWGVLPFYLRTDVVCFGFPSSSLIVDPSKARPDLFRAAPTVGHWLGSHPGAWLMLRSKWLANLRVPFVKYEIVASNDDYTVIHVTDVVPAGG